MDSDFQEYKSKYTQDTKPTSCKNKHILGCMDKTFKEYKPRFTKDTKPTRCKSKNEIKTPNNTCTSSKTVQDLKKAKSSANAFLDKLQDPSVEDYNNIDKEWENQKRKFDNIKKEISDCVEDNQCSVCTKKINRINVQKIMYKKR